MGQNYATMLFFAQEIRPWLDFLAAKVSRQTGIFQQACMKQPYQWREAMDSINLLIICALAFCAVFVLLVILAAVMRLIMSVFPERMVESDAAVFAAITSIASTMYPGKTITKVEEIK